MSSLSSFGLSLTGGAGVSTVGTLISGSSGCGTGSGLGTRFFFFFCGLCSGTGISSTSSLGEMTRRSTAGGSSNLSSSFFVLAELPRDVGLISAPFEITSITSGSSNAGLLNAFDEVTFTGCENFL